VKLAKWQGLGNDYLIIERSALPGPLSAMAISALCDRHLGVGSDGILLVDAPTGSVPGAVARMRVFNPDGSEPEMCGNGIRMFARYLARSGAVSESEFVVETLAGAIKPRLLDDGQVRVDMGQARFHGANLDPGVLWTHGAPLAARVAERPSPRTMGTDIVDAVLRAGGYAYPFTFVDVGNPHCVILVDDPAGFDVCTVGPVIEHHPAFPNRANVEFVRVEVDGSARMRVWERGVGETQACGTGATAVGAALVRLGLATSPVLVRLLGGDLTIEVVNEGGSAHTGGLAAGESAEGSAAGALAPQVFMTGPAEEVFRGELSPDLLHRIGWATAAGD
jgi:diaminopimelate epimerase